MSSIIAYEFIDNSMRASALLCSSYEVSCHFFCVASSELSCTWTCTHTESRASDTVLEYNHIWLLCLWWIHNCGKVAALVMHTWLWLVKTDWVQGLWKVHSVVKLLARQHVNGGSTQVYSETLTHMISIWCKQSRYESQALNYMIILTWSFVDIVSIIIAIILLLFYFMHNKRSYSSCEFFQCFMTKKINNETVIASA